jgi:hypothetical protein
MEEYGSVFIVVRNRRARALFEKMKLPKGSVIAVDPSALDNYISQQEIDKINLDCQAKVMVGHG